MSKRLMITLILLFIISIASRFFIAIQYNMWNFNDENDYKSYYLNTQEIMEMRGEMH